MNTTKEKNEVTYYYLLCVNEQKYTILAALVTHLQIQSPENHNDVAKLLQYLFISVNNVFNSSRLLIYILYDYLKTCSLSCNVYLLYSLLWKKKKQLFSQYLRINIKNFLVITIHFSVF